MYRSYDDGSIGGPGYAYEREPADDVGDVLELVVLVLALAYYSAYALGAVLYGACCALRWLTRWSMRHRRLAASLALLALAIATPAVAVAETPGLSGKDLAHLERAREILEDPTQVLAVAGDLAGYAQAQMRPYIWPLMWLLVMSGLAYRMTAIPFAREGGRQFGISVVWLCAALFVAMLPSPVRTDPSDSKPVYEAYLGRFDGTGLLDYSSNDPTRIGGEPYAGWHVPHAGMMFAHELAILAVQGALGTSLQDMGSMRALSTMSLLTQQATSRAVEASPDLAMANAYYQRHCARITEPMAGRNYDPVSVDQARQVGLGGSSMLFVPGTDPEDMADPEVRQALEEVWLNTDGATPPAHLTGYRVPTRQYWQEHFLRGVGAYGADRWRNIQRYHPPPADLSVDRRFDYAAGAAGDDSRLGSGVAVLSNIDRPMEHAWVPETCWGLYRIVSTGMQSFYQGRASVAGRAETEDDQAAAIEAEACSGLAQARDEPPGGCSPHARITANTSLMVGAKYHQMVGRSKAQLDPQKPGWERQALDATEATIASTVATVAGWIIGIGMDVMLPWMVTFAVLVYIVISVFFPIALAAVVWSPKPVLWTIRVMLVIHLSMLLGYLFVHAGGWSWQMATAWGAQTATWNPDQLGLVAALGAGTILVVYAGIAASIGFAVYLTRDDILGLSQAAAAVGGKFGPGGQAGTIQRTASTTTSAVSSTNRLAGGGGSRTSGSGGARGRAAPRADNPAQPQLGRKQSPHPMARKPPK